MDWKLAADDGYYQARALEARARGEQTPELWEEFAELKKKKGSYTLAVLGYSNAAILREQAGRLKEADALYERAFAVCVRARYKESAVHVSARQAAMHERGGDFAAGARVHERLGNFCESEGALFLAADAFEHAAELLMKAGRDVSDYEKPVKLWECNAAYWEAHGHADDAAWSRRHAELCRKLLAGAKG